MRVASQRLKSGNNENPKDSPDPGGAPDGFEPAMLLPFLTFDESLHINSESFNYLMRMFVGIPLANAVLEELSMISLRLQCRGDGLRWSAPESWHITLQFLGSTGQEQYDCIVAQLRHLHSPPVAIQLGGMGFFDRAGIFFAGVELTPELHLLQQSVVCAATLCDFTPEIRPYRPHVTLAGSKGKDGGPGLRRLRTKIGDQARFTSFVAEIFALYESLPGPAGSRYEIRERFPLKH